MFEELAAARPGRYPPWSNSTIPAIYTYRGQFIDHDMTANTDRDAAVSDITRSPSVPLEPAFVKEKLANLRHPALNLDSLHGDGPTFSGGPATEAASFYVGRIVCEAIIGQLRLDPHSHLNRDDWEPDQGVRLPDGDPIVSIAGLLRFAEVLA